MPKLKNLQKEIQKLKNPAKSKLLQRFFKTGKGEYGEGDKFLGIMVPKQRALVKKYWQDLNLKNIEILLKSKYHEERLIALLILVKQYSSPPQVWGGIKGEVDNSKIQNHKSKIYNFYLSHTKYINNWDLVDLSAHKIAGNYLYSLSLEGEGRVRGEKDILVRLANSKNLWERRIAIISTFAFIDKNNPSMTFKLAKILLGDRHDLIHKAVGWSLREMGKKCGQNILKHFLDKYATKMPRTMLRYAIEKLSQKERKHYLQIK